MSIVVCPGIHPPELTNSFLAGLGQFSNQLLVFPTDRYPAYSTWDILRFLHSRLGTPIAQPPVLFIGFSAGVVGMAGAVAIWQKLGGAVKAVIAMDGWGVPLGGDFPIHRVSHDAFTHWSSVLLGGGGEGFYADPSVPHLDLWRSPQTTQGWWISPAAKESWMTNLCHPEAVYRHTTAAKFLVHLLDRYGEAEAMEI